MRTGYLVAAAAGVIHCGFSVYWGLGGTWLLNTVGSVADAFDGALLLILLVGLAKLAFALVPLVADTRAARWIYRAGAVVLVVWGAASMVGAAIRLPGSPIDPTALWGHLLWWDPLFVVWGIALFAGTMAPSDRGARQAPGR
ncbi:DUF3995 domain-containing protein [Corynebacterium doosanense]|uniref:DUF3995 domain-containing protein n=1 Tax=Corynebacterium doosanense CAU 212 = DSM 45436 TaxID=558173 RepID=A0A097IFA8_9CORY|nr:DUF3995 domain-containing protein [Corynebacterium doosanense]AIT60822.1 hypothetical protein CDOO_05820 [Corynebacterium doosanense CAU 212 = DSM 45436]